MIQKCFIAVWVLLSLVMTPSVAAPQTFHSPNGYSITAPSGWSLGKPGMLGADIFILAKPQQKFANNVNVHINPIPAGVTLQKIQAQIKATYPNFFSNYQYLSGKFTMVDGQRAYETTCHYTQGTPSQKLWVQQDVVIHNGKLYTITCTALASNAIRYASSFNAILKSVHWTGK